MPNKSSDINVVQHSPYTASFMSNPDKINYRLTQLPTFCIQVTNAFKMRCISHEADLVIELVAHLDSSLVKAE